jgi:hypothetical protein
MNKNAKNCIKMEKGKNNDPIALKIYQNLGNTKIKLFTKFYIFLDFIRFSVNFLGSNHTKNCIFPLFRILLLLDKLLQNTAKTILNYFQ